jgi:hypothetical protein
MSAMQRTRRPARAGDNADSVLLAIGNRVGKLPAFPPVLASYRYPAIDKRYNPFLTIDSTRRII